MSADSQVRIVPASAAQPAVRIFDQPGAMESLLHLEQSGLFGTFEFDIVASTLSCSAEMVRRHGLDAADASLTFNKIWERILPGDRERVRAAAIGGASVGQFSVAYRVQAPGEAVRWMQAWVHLQKTADGL